MMYNWDRVAVLLHVVDKANPNQYPQLRHLHTAAMQELMEMKPQMESRPGHVFVGNVASSRLPDDKVEAGPEVQGPAATRRYFGED